MEFRIQQTADYGTEHPAVARLLMQTIELVKFYSLPKEVRDKVLVLLNDEVLPKLMACYRIDEELSKSISEARANIESKGLEFQAGGRAYTLPSVPNLKSKAENFLYNAKSALRDFVLIINALFKTDFEREAREYEKNIPKWAAKHFRQGHGYAEMLQEDWADWLDRLIKMRNAVEHPGGRSGVLQIVDFQALREDSKIGVLEPTWNLNGGSPVAVKIEMAVFCLNMLTFFEESILLFLESFPKPPFVTLREIPENERRSECPIRYEMVLNRNGRILVQQ